SARAGSTPPGAAARAASGGRRGPEAAAAEAGFESFAVGRQGPWSGAEGAGARTTVRLSAVSVRGDSHARGAAGPDVLGVAPDEDDGDDDGCDEPAAEPEDRPDDKPGDQHRHDAETGGHRDAHVVAAGVKEPPQRAHD